MTERYRICKRCEWFCDDSKNTYLGGHGECRNNIFQQSNIDPERKFLRMYHNDYCSSWEPVWNDNQSLKKAWDDFKILHILSIDHE